MSETVANANAKAAQCRAGGMKKQALKTLTSRQTLNLQKQYSFVLTIHHFTPTRGGRAHTHQKQKQLRI